MKVSRPLAVTVPAGGVLFAESVHDSDFRMTRRADPFHKLVYVLKGSVGRESDPDESPEGVAPAGSVLVVPAGCSHRFVDFEPSTLLLLCFSPRFIDSDTELALAWTEIEQAPGRRLWLDRSSRQRLEEPWRRGLLEQAHPRTGSGPMVRALAVQCLVFLARLRGVKATLTSQQRVMTVVREIEETFFEKWTVDRAAARAGLSRRRFTGLFRKVTHRTFNDHLAELRLSHAERLLRSGEHSILGAMFSCGFGDTSHFYRQYKRRFGVPPGRTKPMAGGGH